MVSNGTEGAALSLRWVAGRVAAWDSPVPCLPQSPLHGINRVHVTAGIWQNSREILPRLGLPVDLLLWEVSEGCASRRASCNSQQPPVYAGEQRSGRP